MKDTKNKKNLLFIGIPVIVLLILLRFGLYFLKSDGFNGLSMLLPAGLYALRFRYVRVLCGMDLSGLQKTGGRPGIMGAFGLYHVPLYRDADLFPAPFGNQGGMPCLRTSDFNEGELL